jgi:hypothetical protein
MPYAPLTAAPGRDAPAGRDAPLVGMQERARLLIVLFLALKHLVVDVARLDQARRETTALFSVWVQAKLICSHIRSIHG